MNKILKKRTLLSLIILMTLLMLAGCGGGGGGSDSSVSTGSLSMALTDATTDDYKAVYVTIDRIEVHPGDEEIDPGAWTIVTAPGETYNLLDLVNGVFAELGQGILATGTYGQMRLFIGDTADDENNILGLPHPSANYVIGMDNVPHELKVPSGSQTGIKIIHGFEIFPGQMTELILDFDASRSVVKAGSSTQYLLKPTIKVLEVINSADIFGTVTEENTDPAIPVTGAMVSVQTTNSEAVSIEDEVSIETGTVTTDAGEYALIVDPGTYNIVVTASGYAASCTPVSNIATETTIQTDFSLTSLAGTAETVVPVSGTIIIPDVGEDEEDPYAVLSIRQELTCGETTETVIVKTDQIAAGGTYELKLPEGEYTIVATSASYTALSQIVTVGPEGNTPVNPIDFDFTPTP